MDPKPCTFATLEANKKMALKQVKSDAFEVLLVLLDANHALVLHEGPNKKMGSKQVKSDSFEVLLVLMDAKPSTCATLETKQENEPKTS